MLVLLTYAYLFCQFALFYEFTNYENDFFNHHPCIFNLLYEDSSETFNLQQVYIILRYIVVVFDTHKYFCNHFKLEKKISKMCSTSFNADLIVRMKLKKKKPEK